MIKGYLYTDGGARGNPGPAAIGGVLKNQEEKVIDRFSETIGNATNNQAEYKALLRGLIAAQKHSISRLSCYLDSELVVRQINGEYKIKNADLKPLVESIQKIASEFAQISFEHIPRELNAEADSLVNKALDEAA